VVLSEACASLQLLLSVDSILCSSRDFNLYWSSGLFPFILVILLGLVLPQPLLLHQTHLVPLIIVILLHDVSQLPLLLILLHRLLLLQLPQLSLHSLLVFQLFFLQLPLLLNLLILLLSYLSLQVIPVLLKVRLLLDNHIDIVRICLQSAFTSHELVGRHILLIGVHYYNILYRYDLTSFDGTVERGAYLGVSHRVHFMSIVDAEVMVAVSAIHKDVFEVLLRLY
jgi:hypothetical protein